MEILIGVCLFIGIATLVINRHWLMYMWGKHISGDFNEKHLPFCFNCNKPNCEDCKHLKEWNEKND